MAEFQKNTREIVRCEIGEFRGVDVLNFRVWFDAGGGELRPGKAGLTLRVEQISDLLAAIRECQDEAHRRGLIDGENAA